MFTDSPPAGHPKSGGLLPKALNSGLGITILPRCCISDMKTFLLPVASDNHLFANLFLFLLEGDEAEECTLQLWLNMICQGITEYLTNCVFLLVL